MRYLSKPSITQEEVLKSATSNIENQQLKNHVEILLDYFNNITVEYETKGQSEELSLFPIHESIENKISKDDMIFLYKKMSTKGQPARVYYEKILHSSSICPVCGYRTSGTLDHFLPKTKYPVFSVAPLNLIPCCRDCNSIKRNDAPIIGAETLHPYFDNVENDRWLYAKVTNVNNEPIFNFYVNRPPNMSKNLFSKVQYHFDTFKLSTLYSIVSSTELGDQIYLLQKLFELGGSSAIKDQLLEFHRSAERKHLNHWKSAMYEALSLSEWFCSDGIKSYGQIICK